MKTPFLVSLTVTLSIATLGYSAPTTAPTRGDRMLADYFRNETASITSRCLTDIKTADDWNAKKDEYRRQLAEMLGLWPLPQKSDLKATITGTLETDDFVVEKINFQSLPGLYVTANLYRPKHIDKPLPAILYVCGHAKVKENNVSLGNKTFYQPHGEWFARNGYICLVIDSLELGEIEGEHHGTYRRGWWWWHDRGYTPAGVETWNSIRAIDYLCSRPDVDPNRIGMTGRSGGGAYTWYTAALDQRIKVACPVAGITDMQNQVVDGCIEGHCDCMFLDNTYRWDFPQVAALISPRPLLIGNTDKDTLFPLDGVVRLHEKVRRIYDLQGADGNLGLLITEGEHHDTQDLQVPVFRWFNRFLKGDMGTVDKVATKLLEPNRLRVFEKLPTDQINTTIQESFGPTAPKPTIPASKDDWAKQRQQWISQLLAKTFAAWPDSPGPINLTREMSAAADQLRLSTYRFSSQHDIDLDLYVAQPADAPPQSLRLIVLGEEDWPNFAASAGTAFSATDGDVKLQLNSNHLSGIESVLQKYPHTAVAWIVPRGIGPTAFTSDVKKRTQILRRFALLGQTLDGMRVWDVRRAIEAAKSVEGFEKLPITLEGKGRSAGIALYAALFEPAITRLELTQLPTSHRLGPDLLNVLQVLDMPQTVAMVADKCPTVLYEVRSTDWTYPADVARKLDWPAGQFAIEAKTN